MTELGARLYWKSPGSLAASLLMLGFRSGSQNSYLLAKQFRRSFAHLSTSDVEGLRMSNLTRSDYEAGTMRRDVLRDPRDAAPAISVVVPAYNEEESLPKLHEQLNAALGSQPHELIFVDDGSSDGSMRVLRDLWSRDSQVKVVRLRRNSGKTAALNAGFALASGPVIVTIDADLQDDPAEIPRLVQGLQAGFDLVSGWRATRNDPLSKRLPSGIFNWVVKRLTGIALHDFNCGLKAYRREVLDDIKLYGELHRFIPILAHRRGFLVGEVAVRHHPRQYGHSKFGARRILGGFLDFLKVLFLTRYGYDPLRLFGSAGLVLLAIGLAIGLYLTVIWFGGAIIGRRPLLILCVLLIVAGLQLISTGLIGEMLRRATFSAEDEYAVAETLA